MKKKAYLAPQAKSIPVTGPLLLAGSEGSGGDSGGGSGGGESGGESGGEDIGKDQTNLPSSGGSSWSGGGGDTYYGD